MQQNTKARVRSHDSFAACFVIFTQAYMVIPFFIHTRFQYLFPFISYPANATNHVAKKALNFLSNLICKSAHFLVEVHRAFDLVSNL